MVVIAEPVQQAYIWKAAIQGNLVAEPGQLKDCQVLEMVKDLSGLGRIEINIMESLILAQNERWRRVLSMQVERYLGATSGKAADW